MCCSSAASISSTVLNVVHAAKYSNVICFTSVFHYTFYRLNVLLFIRLDGKPIILFTFKRKYFIMSSRNQIKGRQFTLEKRVKLKEVLEERNMTQSKLVKIIELRQASVSELVHN